MATAQIAAQLPASEARARIPWSHLDLLECPPVAALTTLMPTGYPQTSVVWCDFDGEFVRIDTMRGFAKERNMRRAPSIALLCFDPARPERYLRLEGTVEEMTEAGALAHLDQLASKYLGRTVRYFGDVVPTRFAEAEVPILCLIRPTSAVAVGGAIKSGEA